MSNNAIDAVTWCSRSKGAARLVLLMIANAAYVETDCYVPRKMPGTNTGGGLAYLAHVCNCTERAVRAQLGALVKLGELVIIDRPGRASLYHLPIIAGEEGYDPQECHDESHSCNGCHTPLDRTRIEIKRMNVKARQDAARGSEHPGRILPPSPRKDSSAPKAPRKDSSAPPEDIFRPPRKDSSAPPEDICPPYSHIPISLPIETHAPSPALEKEMEQSRSPVRAAELQFWCRNTPRGRVAMAPYLERANGRERFSDMVAAWNAAHPERLWAVQPDRGELTTGPGIEPVRAS